MELFSIDLFSGCGGLTEGMHQAGFTTKAAFEIDIVASDVYKLNHPRTTVFLQDIRTIDVDKVIATLEGEPLHLLAGCPPCQGFSSMRRKNKPHHVEDERNNLILEFVRLVRELMPYTIMMENVPALIDYSLFQQSLVILREELGYHVDVEVVDVKAYGVPQSRRRLVLVGSKLGPISVAATTKERCTVRDTIAALPAPAISNDPIHKIIPKHTAPVQKRIELTPPNGGSRKDLPAEYTLKCHQKKEVGFSDVYGRLRWDDYSTTITGGCLNPSKGRFLHPEQHRNISAREAALLQTFPATYNFPASTPKARLALMIGNALPPKFSYHQSINIRQHLERYLIPAVNEQLSPLPTAPSSDIAIG